MWRVAQWGLTSESFGRLLFRRSANRSAELNICRPPTRASRLRRGSSPGFERLRAVAWICLPTFAGKGSCAPTPPTSGNSRKLGASEAGGARGGSSPFSSKPPTAGAKWAESGYPDSATLSGGARDNNRPQSKRGQWLLVVWRAQWRWSCRNVSACNIEAALIAYVRHAHSVGVRSGGFVLAPMGCARN